MKKHTKIIFVLGFILIIGSSFFAGRYSKQQEISENRIRRCQTYISFAISKAETQDLSDQGVMKALISNVYAAYECCDNSSLSGQLHDLWNMLIFEGDSFIGKKEDLVIQLESIAEAL